MALRDILINIFIAAIFIFLMVALCHGEVPPGYSNRLADAIYKAEGGAHTRHAYGIMQTWRSTTPRQACLNTIRHQYARWERAGKPGDFEDYLGATYCPVGASNDPGGLNKNWTRNVKHFMQ